MCTNNIKNMATNYPTDLTDAQYDAILRIMGDNRKRKHTLREMVVSTSQCNFFL